MKTYETAHRAAKAVARSRGKEAQVESWLRYADRLIADGTIRAVLHDNGQIMKWAVLDGKEWWLVDTHPERAGWHRGPYQSKHEAIRVAGYSSSRKTNNTGVYSLTATLFVVRTMYLGEYGVEL